MFAVVDIAGKQFKVFENKQYNVPKLNEEPENEIVFDNVLLLSKEDEVKIGAPKIEGVSVTAKIVTHLRDDKIIVFKKKRRKSYKVKNGHRQDLTRIEITKIG